MNNPDVRQMVFDALTNAVMNGYRALVVCGDVKTVADDLVAFDAGLSVHWENPASLIPFIEEWRADRKQRQGHGVS